MALFVVKVTADVIVPLQTNWLEGTFTCPAGLTVKVMDSGGPVQLTDPLVNVGVTMMVATTGDVLLLKAVNEAMLPEPLAVHVAEPDAEQVQLAIAAFVEVSVTVAPVTFDVPALETTMI